MILFVVNIPEFFISHRLPLAIALKDIGQEVHIATADGDKVNEIISMGFVHHKIDFSRSGQNPFWEFRTFLQLYLLIKKLKPELIHLISIKPVLYGGIAARLLNICPVVSAISGLGTVFMKGSLLKDIRKIFVKILYRLALNHRSQLVIFQNCSDLEELIGAGALDRKQARLIYGSGVDLLKYPALPEPIGPTVVVMAARLLKDKGVYDFCHAARILRERGLGIKMRLIGALDPHNPSGISITELEKLLASSCVEFLGFKNNVSEFYQNAHIICLPSYREGLPKSLIEGSACARAVVTTDVAGCRDAVISGVTGLTVPVKDPHALADAIQILSENPKIRREMGRAGRKLVEKKFALPLVVKQHMEIYAELLGSLNEKV